MKFVRLLVPLVVLLLPGCGELLDPAAAVVGGDKITVEHITSIVDAYEGSREFKQVAGQGDPQEILRQYEQTRLSQLIRRAVLEPRAEDLDVDVTDDDVARRREQIKADFPSEEAFQDALAEQGLTSDYLNELVYDSLLEGGLRAKVTQGAGPTDDELCADIYACRFLSGEPERLSPDQSTAHPCQVAKARRRALDAAARGARRQGRGPLCAPREEILDGYFECRQGRRPRLFLRGPVRPSVRAGRGRSLDR